VVEAAAAGKNAAEEADAFISGKKPPRIEKATKSSVAVPGYAFEPVSLETVFFGRRLSAPFLLSASPATDGFEQVRRRTRRAGRAPYSRPPSTTCPSTFRPRI
jgi:hypothetical protein